MKLVANNLYRGARPKSATHISGAVQTVICLQSGFRNLLTNDAYERTFLADYDIKEYRIHCSDIWPPQRWHVETFLRKVQAAERDGKKVLVHCMSGVDRTGFMCAVYRMRVQGWKFEQAYDEWVSEGRHFWYDWWKKALRGYQL